MYESMEKLKNIKWNFNLEMLNSIAYSKKALVNGYNL